MNKQVQMSNKRNKIKLQALRTMDFLTSMQWVMQRSSESSIFKGWWSCVSITWQFLNR